MNHLADIKLQQTNIGYTVSWTEKTQQADWGNAKQFKHLNEAKQFLAKLKAREQNETRAIQS